MTCTVCNFEMDAFADDCPRCHGIAKNPTVYVPAPKVDAPAKVSAPPRRCIKCGIEVEKSAIDCPGCGDALLPGTKNGVAIKFCPDCGAARVGAGKFCAGCGLSFGSPTVSKPSSGASPQFLPGSVAHDLTNKNDCESSGVFLISFLFPIGGALIWALQHTEYPKRAASASRGALIGLFFGIVLCLMFPQLGARQFFIVFFK